MDDTRDYTSDDEEYYDALNDETFGKVTEDCTWQHPDSYHQETITEDSSNVVVGVTPSVTPDGGDFDLLNTSWVERFVELVVADEENDNDKLQSAETSVSYTSDDEVCCNFNVSSDLIPSSQRATEISRGNTTSGSSSSSALESSIWAIPQSPCHNSDSSSSQSNTVTLLDTSSGVPDMPHELMISKKQVENEILGKKMENEHNKFQAKPTMLKLEDVERELLKETLPVPVTQFSGDGPVLPLTPRKFGQVPRAVAPHHYPFPPHPIPPNGGGIYPMPSHVTTQLNARSSSRRLLPRQPLIPIISSGMVHRRMPPFGHPLHPFIRVRAPTAQQFFNGAPPPPPFGSWKLPDVVAGASDNVRKFPHFSRLLLTKRDQLRLKYIQSIQLKNDHPFTTDYYDLMLKAKMATMASISTGKEVQLHFLTKLYGRTAEESKFSDPPYQPASFENCLGKLHGVSSLAPRRVMDTFILLSEGKSLPKNSLHLRRRHVLLEIEKLYQSLLVMEEFQIRSYLFRHGLGEEVHQTIIEKRHEAETQIAKALTNRAGLYRVLTVTKGKMLTCRALPILEPAFRYPVLGHLLSILPIWSGDPDFERKALPHLRHAIFSANEIEQLRMTILGGEVASRNDQDFFKALVTSPLGVTLLMAIFSQAEKLLMTLSERDILIRHDIDVQWTKVSQAGLSIILEMSDVLPSPLEAYPNILHHLRRFPFYEVDIKGIQAVLQRWGYC